MDTITETSSAADVARATRGCRGHQTIKAITELRRERQRLARLPGMDHTTLDERLHALLVERWTNVIAQRGGENE